MLNPDLEFEPKIIDSLIEYADSHKDVVYILPKVLYPDGELQGHWYRVLRTLAISLDILFTAVVTSYIYI